MLTGTATGVGEQAGAAVAQVVRDRLGASDRGRAALTELEGAEASPEAQAGAAAVLTEEIEADPRLRHALTVHLDAPRAAGGVFIDRSRVRGDIPVLVGSGTINFRKPTSAAGMVALVLAVLVVLSVMVLAVHGGSSILGADDSPDSSHGSGSATVGSDDGPASSSGSKERTVAPRALTVAETKDVVPALEDMPSGWAVGSARNGFPVEGDTGCNAGTANYDNPEENSGHLTVTYRVTACRDVRTVTDGYAEELKRVGTSDPEETRIAMPKCGDESFATSYTVTGGTRDRNGTHVEIRARVGAVFIDMNYGPTGDGAHRLDSLERAGELMRLVCDRAVASQSTP
ncbi:MULTISPECIES: hypothetical protein [Streptomyces]|uniref:Serine/threonine protein kinase n=1 Tax=Streptomyces lycii TaxID=2654337 RepID=A0ABQ7FCD9_9ACTN|nr:MULTISPECIES: hypothetical protein [Streptomyces]KAF4406158.1 hypothetical protein GCU69_26490 [Streptomyces lycii]